MRTAIEWLFGRVDVNGKPCAHGRLCTNNVRHRTGADLTAYKNGATMRAILCATNRLRTKWNDVVRKMITEDVDRLGYDGVAEYHAAHCSTMVGDDNGEHRIAEAAIADDAHLLQGDPTIPDEKLKLHIGDTVMLAKTLCPRARLAKNDVFTIVALRKHTIVIASPNNNQRFTIARTRFKMQIDSSGVLNVERKQMPTIHAWAVVSRATNSTTHRPVRGSALHLVPLCCRLPSTKARDKLANVLSST